jgi:hypothetical protein
MKIKVFEYHRYKAGVIKIHEYTKHKGKYKLNPNYAMHKMLVTNTLIYPIYPIIYQKEYEVEK